MSVIYGISDPEFVGAMPVRQDIEVLPADEVTKVAVNDHIVVTSKRIVTDKPLRQFTLGWKVRETIGIGFVNKRGVSKGRKSVIVGK